MSLFLLLYTVADRVGLAKVPCKSISHYEQPDTPPVCLIARSTMEMRRNRDLLLVYAFRSDFKLAIHDFGGCDALSGHGRNINTKIFFSFL